MNHPSSMLLNRNRPGETDACHGLALTKENLLRLEEDTEPSVDILSRYYSSLLPSTPTPDRREQSASPTHCADSGGTLATRLLFPYHNDSLFLLPIVEHSATSSPSRSSCSPSTSIGSLSLTGSAYAFATGGSDIQTYAMDRCASPESQRCLPHRIHSAPPLESAWTRRAINTDSADSTNSSFASSVTLATLESPSRKPKKTFRWLMGFIKRFKSRKFTKAAKAAPLKTTASSRMSDCSRVWYSQYAANPEPPVRIAVG